MSRKDEVKNRTIVRSLLAEWYDRERAKTESAAYTQKAVKIGDLADKFLQQAASPEVVDGIRLREAWTEIAGKQIAAISDPVTLRDGIAEVEVSHSAWLRELNGPIKRQLLGKINQLLGENHCRDIRFVPGARKKS